MIAEAKNKITKPGRVALKATTAKPALVVEPPPVRRRGRPPKLATSGAVASASKPKVAPEIELPTVKSGAQIQAGGNLLFQMLLSHASDHNESTRDLAGHLGITYGHLMVLARGERPVHGLSINALRNAARYLHVSLAQAYVWAGILSPSDFYSTRTVREELDRLYVDLIHDNTVSMFAPERAEWDALPERSKLTIALMYEALRHRNYMSMLSVPQTNMPE